MMFMSGTLPNSFINLIEKHTGLKTRMIDDISDNNRIRVNINSISDDEEIYNQLLNQISSKKTAIVYCNTIERAIYAYNKILEKVENKNDVILYHSAFIEGDKFIIEKKILEKLGKEAWENNNACGIVIMTQIGELSINISSDYILTDICPMDRLGQRFGRGCRFYNYITKKYEICDIDIIIPTKKGIHYPAPYGTPTPAGWIELESLTKTKSILRTGTYNYTELLEAINLVYENFELTQRDIENSNLLKKLNNENFIFNNLNINDDSNNTAWKARNINPQITLYVGHPKTPYYNEVDWYNDKTKNIISIPYYENKLKKHILDGKIYKEIIKINNKEIEEIYCLNSECYSSEYGVNLENLINNFM